jgi:tripartite-type tricarboxylate transporter receptor subunit TctC
VPVFFTVLGNAVPFEKSGKVRLLGVASAQRLRSHPNLPTIAEAGIKGFIADPWFGLLAPAQTPHDVVNKIAAEVAAATEAADVKEKMRSYFLEPSTATPEEFSGIIKGDLARWSSVIREAKVKID